MNRPSGIAASALVACAAAGGVAPATAARAHSRPASTARTFELGPGRDERRFTLRERSGVILLSRLTVPHGVRARVDATIPGVAGTGFSTRRPNDPALVCRRRGSFDVCTQQQEWCPMPAAIWRLRLVKESGPAGPVRVDFVIAAPPAGA